MTEELRFASHGPHPYVFFAVPFGLILLAMAVLALGIGPKDVGTAIGAAGAAAFGAWVLLSCSASIWGRIEIRREGNRCAVKRSLGGWTRNVEFLSSEVRGVERYSPSPGVIVWPGKAGQHLRVVLQHKERPFAIGEGLCLDEKELKSIEELLCAPA